MQLFDLQHAHDRGVEEPQIWTFPMNMGIETERERINLEENKVTFKMGIQRFWK